eukprot:1194489-Prorocentrum_minimum.AAC.1
MLRDLTRPAFRPALSYQRAIQQAIRSFDWPRGRPAVRPALRADAVARYQHTHAAVAAGWHGAHAQGARPRRKAAVRAP